MNNFNTFMRIFVLFIIIFFHTICANAQQQHIFEKIAVDIRKGIESNNSLCTYYLNNLKIITNKCSFKIIPFFCFLSIRPASCKWESASRIGVRLTPNCLAIFSSLKWFGEEFCSTTISFTFSKRLFFILRSTSVKSRLAITNIIFSILYFHSVYNHISKKQNCQIFLTKRQENK